MLKKTVLSLLFVVISIQFIPLQRTNPKIDPTSELQAPSSVMNILKRSCYDCHSNETKWSKYAYIAPLSFGIVSHVKDGRKALNFSNYKNIPNNIKKMRLKRAIQTIKIDRMPLSSYTLFHKEVKLSKDDKKVLIDWFNKEYLKVKNNGVKGET